MATRHQPGQIFKSRQFAQATTGPHRLRQNALIHFRSAMSSFPRLLSFAFGLVTACSPQAVLATSTVAHAYPDFPAADKLPLLHDPGLSRVNADGSSEWIGSRLTRPGSENTVAACSWEVTHVRWNPGTGDIRMQAVKTPGWLWLPPKPVAGITISQTTLPDGFAWLSRCTNIDMANFGLVVRGHVFLTETNVHLGDKPVHMIALSDRSAAAITRDPKSRHIVVHVLQLVDGELHDEVMPELPIAYNDDFAFAVLDAQRLMILGGSDERYRGCMSCRDETHILDIASKRWNDGPRMLEARSELSATRLPDGSVLVAGGWTRAAGWGYYGPSRTAERWNPATNTFESIAPMPVGDAGQRGMWMPGRDGKTLLMVDGLSASVPAYDLPTATWRIIGSWPHGSEKAGCGFFPFFAAGQAYAWAGCTKESAVAEPLHRYWDAMPSPASSIGVDHFSGRAQAAIVPAAGDLPALIIGGTSRSGMSSQPTTTVEAIDTQGRVFSMPSLIDAQTDAQARRLHGGVLVFAGRIGGPDRRKKNISLPMEWLADPRPGSHATWQPVDGIPPAAESGVAELADGGLLEVDAKGHVNEIRLVLIHGRPTLQRDAWPGFAQPRHSSAFARMTVRQLSDGRLIASGGDTPLDSIALMEPSTNDSHAADHYQPIGPLGDATTYAIFDPVSRRWSASARSPMRSAQTATSSDGRWMKVAPDNDVQAGGSTLYAIFPSPDANSSAPEHAPWISMQTAIADNGRVVQIVPVVDSLTSRRSWSIAVSSPDGSSWHLLPRDAFPHVSPDTAATLYEVDGEVLLQDRDKDGVHVEWFDPAALNWHTVWTISPESLTPAGMLQIVKLPDNRTVVLTETPQ